jgi:glycosyltransferase involved in cell wall biosynthesis
MKKVKVLQVNKLYYPWIGGVEHVVQQLAEGLNNQTDMKVLVCQAKGKTAVEKVNGVMVHRAGSLGMLFSMPISVSFFRHFRKLSKDRDVIHFHMPFPLGDLACLLSGYKGKVVVWWHSDIVKQKKLMKLYKPFMDSFLSRADVIITATQGHIDGSDYLLKHKNKCVIIPYGIDKRIEKNSDLYIEKSKQLRGSLKPVQMLFVGRLVYYKGCDILIEAFKKVDNAELTIIGEGELKKVIEEKVRQYNMTEKVHLIGKVKEEEICKAYEDCDVLVLPSTEKSEAFGLVQIEAMTFGKPVINTNLSSGVPYVSLDGVTGLTVPPNDVQALADAMKWMVEHDKERNEMGRRARNRVKECFRMDDMLDKVLKIYNYQEKGESI